MEQWLKVPWDIVQSIQAVKWMSDIRQRTRASGCMWSRAHIAVCMSAEVEHASRQRKFVSMFWPGWLQQRRVPISQCWLNGLVKFSLSLGLVDVKVLSLTRTLQAFGWQSCPTRVGP